MTWEDEQLKRDLAGRVKERMHTVIKDTFALYEMADLDARDAVVAIADVLLRETARVMAASEADALVCGALITAMIRNERGEISARQLGQIVERFRRGATSR